MWRNCFVSPELSAQEPRARGPLARRSGAKGSRSILQVSRHAPAREPDARRWQLRSRSIHQVSATRLREACNARSAGIEVHGFTHLKRFVPAAGLTGRCSRRTHHLSSSHPDFRQVRSQLNARVVSRTLVSCLKPPHIFEQRSPAESERLVPRTGCGSARCGRHSTHCMVESRTRVNGRALSPSSVGLRTIVSQGECYEEPERRLIEFSRFRLAICDWRVGIRVSAPPRNGGLLCIVRGARRRSRDLQPLRRSCTRSDAI
jgi:hypothetical protein